MGFYIEVPRNKQKATQLVEMYGAEVIPEPEEYWMHDPNQSLICVVNNGLFEAAGLCFDEQEFNAFKFPDGRPRIWLLMDRTKAWKLTGFKEEYVRG